MWLQQFHEFANEPFRSASVTRSNFKQIKIKRKLKPQTSIQKLGNFLDHTQRYSWRCLIPNCIMPNSKLFKESFRNSEDRWKKNFYPQIGLKPGKYWLITITSLQKLFYQELSPFFLENKPFKDIFGLEIPSLRRKL